MKEDVTVVIPTHERPRMLRRLLQSISRLRDARPRQVIVVDDSENPAYVEGQYPGLDIKHVVSHRRVFISKAKNIGWKDAETEFVYFIDDDNVVEENTFAPLFETMLSDSSIGALMPGVVYFDAPDLVWVYATPFRDRRLGFNLIGRNAPRDSALEGRLLKTDALPNASLVRVEAMRSVGGFDERLVVNSSMDLAQRLKGRGWGVYANTSGLIRHDVEVPGRAGWWAVHGSADPGRVRYELRDWFLISKRLHPETSFFRPRFALKSLGFVGPNLLAYAVRSKERVPLLRSLVTAYAEGFELTGGRVEGYRTTG